MGVLSMLFRIGADTSEFEIGAKRVQSLGEKMAKKFKGELAAGAAALFAADRYIEFGRRAIETAGRLSDLSKELGVSAQFLQEMGFAAEMSGASLDDVKSGLQKSPAFQMK